MFPVLSCFRQKLQLPKICVMKFYDRLKIFNATCFMSARQCYEKVLWPILQLFISSRTIFIRSSSNGLLLTLMTPITVFIPPSKSSRRVFVDFNVKADVPKFRSMAISPSLRSFVILKTKEENMIYLLKFLNTVKRIKNIMINLKLNY